MAAYPRANNRPAGRRVDYDAYNARAASWKVGLSFNMVGGEEEDEERKESET